MAEDRRVGSFSPGSLPQGWVGEYQIGGTLGIQVRLLKRPSRWHRFWMRVCLGIEWKDLPHG